MRKRILFIGVCCFITLITHNISFGHFKLELNVPLYGQKCFYYCGPACAQMMMMGYPLPVTRKLYDQEVDIYPKILQYRTDNHFSTDPDGLCSAVMKLNPPPQPGHYVIFSGTDQGIIMHNILFWMATREYPTAALVQKGAHWVVITGFETDKDPRLGNVTLDKIDINDPCLCCTYHKDPCHGIDVFGCDPGIGVIKHLTGSTWLTEEFQPNTFGDIGSKWLNHYVAIVEPPKISGKVTIEEESYIGLVIPPKKAKELALKYIKEEKLYLKESFAFLKEPYPKEALPVNQEYKHYYYIIPFGLEKGKLSLGAVLLNAHTGKFQEVGAFSKPLEYLTKKEAIKIAIHSIKERPIKLPIAELFFELSEQTRSRYCPLWKVLIPVEGSIIIRYVNQSGTVYPELKPLHLGGN